MACNPSPHSHKVIQLYTIETHQRDVLSVVEPNLGISSDFFTISKQLLIFQTNIRSANLFCIRTSRSELGAARMHQCVHSHTHAAHAICVSTLWRRSVLSNGHSRTKVKYCTRVAGEQQTSWLCHETDWSPPQSCCVTSSELAHF